MKNYMKMFNNKMMLATFCTLISGGSAIADSVDLTMKWKPMHQYSIKQIFDFDMTMPNPQGGDDMATKMNTVMGMKGPSQADEEGVVVDMKIDSLTMNMAMGGNNLMSYDSSKPDADNPMHKALAPMLELNIKTLYGKDGKFVKLKDFNDDLLTPETGLTKEGLESMMKQSSEMIPDGEVKVGKVWASVLKVPMQGVEAGLSCNYNFKLVSVQEVDGKKLAKIEFNADMEEMKMKQNGIDMLLNAKNIDGHYLFDVDGGQFTELETFFDMTATVQDMVMTMKMAVKLEFSNSLLKNN